MAEIVAILADQSRIEFDKGAFDHWCVYLSRLNKPRYAPKDIEYFSILQKYATLYGNEKLYHDFVQIYDLTTSTINLAVINRIVELSTFYKPYQNEIAVWFTVIYAGMIAEENKKYAVLKKRIKRLGLHQVLIDNIEPFVAANFSKGKKWPELDVICKSKKF